MIKPRWGSSHSIGCCEKCWKFHENRLYRWLKKKKKWLYRSFGQKFDKGSVIKERYANSKLHFKPRLLIITYFTHILVALKFPHVWHLQCVCSNCLYINPYDSLKLSISLYFFKKKMFSCTVCTWNLTLKENRHYKIGQWLRSIMIIIGSKNLERRKLIAYIT